jgi:hypothetical protein
MKKISIIIEIITNLVGCWRWSAAKPQDLDPHIALYEKEREGSFARPGAPRTALLPARRSARIFPTVSVTQTIFCIREVPVFA